MTADLPVQESVKVELVLNLKTGKFLGITLPLPLLAIADAVLELILAVRQLMVAK